MRLLLKAIGMTVLLTHTGPAIAANYSEVGAPQQNPADTLLPAHLMPSNEHAYSLDHALGRAGFEDQAFAGLEGLRRVDAPGRDNNRSAHLASEPERIPLPLIAHIVTILIGGVLFSVSLKTHRKRATSDSTTG